MEADQTCVISPIAIGLVALFTGLCEKKDEERGLYDKMAESREAWNGFPSNAQRRIRISAMNLGLAALGAGNNDLALRWFVVAATKDRDPLAMILHLFSTVHPLRKHQGFRSFVTETMKLKLNSQL